MRSYQPKHAKPALHPTRSTLSAGLTAALLPLCLASPALADGHPATPAPTTSSSPEPTATAEATASPESSATAAGSASPSPEASDPTPSASPEQEATLETELRISGPGGAVSPGSHTIGVRLLADGKPVKDGYVRLERRTANGWEYAGRLLTKADGLGLGTLHFTKSTRLRATYAGAPTRTAATSREIVVTVAASFRAHAVQIAAQQQGKPYRYGSVGPNSFDCSGLMVYVFKKVGKNLPRTSQAQLRATQRIAKTAKQPGDLIFTQRGGRIGHVGVYAGDGKFWVAPKAGDVVKLQRIYTTNYLVGRVS